MSFNYSDWLQKKWGDKPCDHPVFQRDIQGGQHSGDYMCQVCGKLFSTQEYHAILEQRKKDEPLKNTTEDEDEEENLFD